jgi:hypothetical protein
MKNRVTSFACLVPAFLGKDERNPVERSESVVVCE